MVNKSSSKHPQFFYPYCGLKKGWCTSDKPCSLKMMPKNCKYYSQLHPLTLASPRLISDEELFEEVNIDDIIEEKERND